MIYQKARNVKAACAGKHTNTDLFPGKILSVNDAVHSNLVRLSKGFLCLEISAKNTLVGNYCAWYVSTELFCAPTTTLLSFSRNIFIDYPWFYYTICLCAA